MTYICPKCKQMMHCISTASIPPIITYECFQCGCRSRPIRETEYATPLPEWLMEDKKAKVYVKDLDGLPESCDVCPFRYFDPDWGWSRCSYCDEPITINGRLGDCPLYEDES